MSATTKEREIMGTFEKNSLVRFIEDDTVGYVCESNNNRSLISYRNKYGTNVDWFNNDDLEEVETD